MWDGIVQSAVTPWQMSLAKELSGRADACWKTWQRVKDEARARAKSGSEEHARGHGEPLKLDHRVATRLEGWLRGRYHDMMQVFADEMRESRASGA
jgi:hypothetical protein